MLFLSGGSKAESIHCHFWLLVATCIPCLLVSLSHHSVTFASLLKSPSLTQPFLVLSAKDLSNYIGITQIIQENMPSLKIPALIRCAVSAVSSKVP